MQTIITPLATWLYLLIFLPPALFLHLRSRRRMSTVDAEKSLAKRSKWASVSLAVLYYLLIVALIAMQSLVLARLVAANLGIGLLPFTYVGLLVALGVHIWVQRTPGGGSLVAANTLWWVVLAAVLIVTVVGVSKEGLRSTTNAHSEEEYPYTDRITDDATMVGVSFVVAMLEVGSYFLK